MFGQWIAEIEEDGVRASIRIELDDYGKGAVGHAYIFYPGTTYPGFMFQVRLPKDPPFKSTVMTEFLWPGGGVMTAPEDVGKALDHIKKNGGQDPPPRIDVEFSMKGDALSVSWAAEDGRGSTIDLALSSSTGPSELTSRPDLDTWEKFRQWAVSQRPRNYIFRGQRNPHKLVSSFHRLWRNDLRRWILDDVSLLYGAVAERLSYPLQIGNLQHNAAIWSVLQHHGYPTPLLDWSFSPFVAAYFAFQGADDDSAPRIYIFDQDAWNERYGRSHFIVDAAPAQVIVIQSMAVANPRHGPQQAISTVTNVADVEGFIREKEARDGVSYLTVCDLPLDARPQIMQELELMGITYGSLFPGLDGICRDMKDRLFAQPK